MTQYSDDIQPNFDKTQMVREGETLSTKDDLSVVLGEFDLSSDSDEFDSNRFLIP